jgi:hypothetical protein
VIWATFNTLRKLEKLYESGQLASTPDIFESCAYATFDYDENKFLNKFGRITTLFDFTNDKL